MANVSNWNKRFFELEAERLARENKRRKEERLLEKKKQREEARLKRRALKVAGMIIGWLDETDD